MRMFGIGLLVLAMSFRFIHLDRKVYWHDEVYTSTVITARPGHYLSEALFQNKFVKPADLLAYQQFVPGLTLTDMIVRKGLEDSQHPPFYYILLYFWAQIAGTAPAVLRGFSALLNVLIFPAVYWLCLELFESSLAGWIAIALFAVSPFHLVFAQEVREFGVWTAIILACSALLLRAIRSPSGQNWLWYGASMLVACYTALFTLWIAVGHFLYTLVIDPKNQFCQRPMQIGRRTILCSVTLLGVGLLFIPWLYFMVASGDLLGATTSWVAVPLPLDISLQMISFNFSRGFVDFNADLSDILAQVLAIALLILQGYAVYVLCRTAPKRIWWFILTFTGVTALALGLPDLIHGGQRFTVTRYLIPCIVGLQLAVVYLLTTYFTAPLQSWKFRFATTTFSILLILGIASCGVYAQANTWWNKVLNSNYHQVAELINSSDRPLIIADASSYNSASVVSLSYLLKPDTQLLLLPADSPDLPLNTLPGNIKTVFLFNLPEALRQHFEAKYQRPLVQAFQDPWNDIWKNP
ncbi:glycosyltransferase family 39 protein [Leptodesmis sichuanensis]|uniref:glycosyltransferase family 39 protein n=1 Tax=Leptodesmis sichuanensis TaxID=2906798 RepID=UPI001F3371E4|nr:glycosyltransferase family 39 protein [Leptodesmis sichuanensis]UIE39474.1 hypothetical protein KIK02_07910 [Leptodesmis sichuanensis A121]